MFVHGANLSKKEKGDKKYTSPLHKKYLAEIREKYTRWSKDNLAIIGPLREAKPEDKNIIQQRVDLLNEYKDFIDCQKYAEAFDSRSNLHSTVLEEFMYYLFKDLVEGVSKEALIGKSHTFKDIFFLPNSFESMLQKPNILVERKDHDFAIGAKFLASIKCFGKEEAQETAWDIPAIAIECKTYLDKTMLQDASTASEQLKAKNPNAMYIIVAEWLKLTEAINLKKFKIDQIYILRKQKNTDREFRFLPAYEKNPIYFEVIWHLFEQVRIFLTSSWEGGLNFGLDRGYLL